MLLPVPPEAAVVAVALGLVAFELELPRTISLHTGAEAVCSLVEPAPVALAAAALCHGLLLVVVVAVAPVDVAAVSELPSFGRNDPGALVPPKSRLPAMDMPRRLSFSPPLPAAVSVAALEEEDVAGFLPKGIRDVAVEEEANGRREVFVESAVFVFALACASSSARFISSSSERPLESCLAGSLSLSLSLLTPSAVEDAAENVPAVLVAVLAPSLLLVFPNEKRLLTEESAEATDVPLAVGFVFGFAAAVVVVVAVVLAVAGLVVVGAAAAAADNDDDDAEEEEEVVVEREAPKRTPRERDEPVVVVEEEEEEEEEVVAEREAPKRAEAAGRRVPVSLADLPSREEEEEEEEEGAAVAAAAARRAVVVAELDPVLCASSRWTSIGSTLACGSSAKTAEQKPKEEEADMSS